MYRREIMDYTTVLEIPEKVENEWRTLENAFLALRETVKEIQEQGRCLTINGLVIDAKNLEEAAQEFYRKISSIIKKSSK